MIAICGALSIAGPSGGQVIGEDASAVDLHELYYGAHLPRDRAASRALDLAEELIAQRRFSEAIPLLVGIFADSDDEIDLDDGSESPPASLKRRARGLLGRLPAAGLEAYRLEIGSQSERKLAAAIRSGNPHAVGEVARLYPDSAAASSALWLLARAAHDLGDHDTSIAALRRLEAAANAAEFEPQRSLLEATAWLGQGQPEPAREILDRLAQSSWRTTRLETGATLSEPAAVMSWLAEIIGVDEGGDPTKAEWGIAGGGSRRNPVRKLGLPHPFARWTAMTVVDPREEDRRGQFNEFLETAGRPTAGACQPIGVGNLVLLRTVNNLLAIDSQSGRRVWETRPETRPSDDEWDDLGSRFEEESTESGQWRAENVRHWFDQVTSGVSSDGRNAYVVEPVVDSAGSFDRWSRVTFQRSREAASLGPAENRLAAYDIGTEGKLIWSRGDRYKDQLAGAFFLGVPLPVGGRLFALAETDQSICLLELDPSDGGVAWRQPLVGVDRAVQQSSMRRLIGAATAEADGVIVCSTGAGVIVAVDRFDRSIAWVDRFPVASGRKLADVPGWRRRPTEIWHKEAHRGWLENRVLVAGDRVVAVSPESPMVHCLDLKTGAPIWRASREGASLLSAVVGGAVLVSAADQVRAIDIKNGRTLWRARWARDRRLSGRGVVADDVFLVPLSDGTVLALDTKTGEETKRLRCWSGAGAGNLIVHRGSLYSQSNGALDRFDPQDLLLAEAGRRLEADSRDVASLCVLGEAQLCDGELDKAMESFLAAYRADAVSPLVRQRLRRTIAERLREQAPTAADLDLLGQLVDTPRQRVALKVQAAALARREKDLVGVVELALTLPVPPSSGGLVVDCGDGHVASPTSRLASLLTAAWDESDASARERAAEILRAAGAQMTSASEIDRFAKLFGGLPCCTDTMQRRLDAMLRDRRPLERAFYLAATEPESGPAPGGAPRDPRWSTRQVESRMTSRGAEAMQDPFGLGRTRRVGWRRVPMERRGRLADPGSGGPGIVDLAIDADHAELVGLDAFGGVAFESELRGEAIGFVRQARSDKRATVWRFGPCLYLAAGENLVAFETLPDAEAPDRRLWSTEGLLQGIDHDLAAGIDSAPRAGGSRRIKPGAPMAIVGVSARGLIAQKDHAVFCIDALDGTLRWLRTGIAPSGKVISDHDFVYLTTSDRKPLRLSTLDGSDAGGWRPPGGQWHSFRNGLLTTIERVDGKSVVSILDVTHDATPLSRSYDVQNQMTPVDGGGLAVLELKTGRFEILDTATGRVRIETSLPLSAASVGSLVVAARSDRLVVSVGYVATPRSLSTRITPLDTGRGIVGGVNGQVFCLDGLTGEPVWSRPLQLEGRSWLARQPRGSPLLVFAAKREARKSGRTSVSTRLLVVDVLTGRAVYRNDQLEENSVDAYQVRYFGGGSPELRLVFPGSQITLGLSEAPAPPLPPASDATESAPRATAGVGSMFGQIQRIFSDAVQPREREEQDDD